MRLLLCLIVAAVAGAALGAALWGLDRVGAYFVLIFPMVAGFLIGGATVLPMTGRKTATLPLLVLALLGGAIALSVYWGGSYLSYVEDTVTLIQTEAPKTTREEAIDLMNTFLESEYGSTGFQGFISDYAALGLSINRSISSTSSGIELQNETAYAFWIIEAVLLLGAAIIAVFRRENSVLYKRATAANTAR